jgi:TonB-linked SusC/RagA family outer membrane protein
MRWLLYFLLTLLLILTSALHLYGQKEIQGYVVNEQGDRLIGVNVVGTQSQRGTITDLEGNYRIEVPKNEKALVFTYIGMERRVAVIGDRDTINVTLKETSAQMEEVVVTAYTGPKEHRDLVGSYSQASHEELETLRPIESLDQMLEGKVAGVQVESAGGEPGLPVKVRIRGQGSFINALSSDVSASAQPLYVVDGVPMYDVEELNATNTVFSDVARQRLNPLAMLNAEDIESVTVLKDAAATAIYGANASNGVILITTKKGEKGAHQIQFSTTQGVSSFINDVKLLNSREYVNLYRETLFNSGLDPSAAGSAEVNTDWRGLVRQQGWNSNTNLSFSGGNDNMTYRLSLGHFYLRSIGKRNDLERYTANLSLTQKFSDRVQLESGLIFSRMGKEAINTFTSQGFPPNISPFLPDGTFNDEGFFATRPNPLAVLEQNENEHQNFDVTGRTRLQIKLFPFLRLSSSIGVNLYSNRQRQYDSALNGSGRNRNGFLRINDVQNFRWIWRAKAQGSGTVGNHHNWSYLAGTEVQDRTNERLQTRASNFLFDGLREIDFAANEDISGASRTFRDALISYFGDLSYNYDYRYYLNASWRQDASSLFGGDVRRAQFMAVGASWVFSEERFFPLDFISYGKIRSSFGSTGNARIGSYAASGTYGLSTSNQYGGLLGAQPQSAPNPGLGWESNYKFNLGLDLGFSDETYRLTLEYYRNTVRDAITTIEVPRESGYNSVIINGGSMRNWGYEATFQLRGKLSTQLRWRMNFNIALNRNRVLEIPIERVSQASAQGIRVGEDINTLYGVKYAGVDPYNGQALYELPDGSITDNRNEAYDLDNRQPIGRSAPLYSGGWTTSVQWKKWSASVFLNFAQGQDFLMSEFYSSDGRQISFLNQSVNQLDRWQQPGDITYVPRLDVNNPFHRTSTRLLFSADFLEINNVTLGYQPFQDHNIPTLKYLQFQLAINRLGIWYAQKSKADRNGPREFRYNFPRQRTYSLTVKTRI